jgi:ubiquinone/menaquinone biosynthesis C-methylase UbiE
MGKSKTLIALNEEYKENESVWSESEKHLFIRFMNPQRGERILNVGCGQGTMSKWLIERGAWVASLDFSFKHCAMTRTHTGDEKIANANAAAIPFRSNFFDKVVFIETLEHIPREFEESVLHEIYRVLKPGGTLCLHTSPNTLAKYFLYLFNPLFFLTTLKIYRYDRSMDTVHINQKTPSELQRLVRRNGFVGTVKPYSVFFGPMKVLKLFPFLNYRPFSYFFGQRMRGVFRKNVE